MIWVAGYDLHFPKYDRATFKTMLACIREWQPGGFIFGGDQFDNAEISHHNKKKPLYKETASYGRNQEQFRDTILRPLESALPTKCQKVWIIGNHDYWEYEFVEAHPEFDGFVDRPKWLGLAERGWEVVGIGHTKHFSKLDVIHGEVLTGIGNQAGKYPAAKAVDIYGSNVLAGHTHAPQSYARISPVEKKHKHMGWIAPILGATNPAYLENRPTAWMQGFVRIEFYKGGYFNLYPIITFNGRCSFGGKVYGM